MHVLGQLVDEFAEATPQAVAAVLKQLPPSAFDDVSYAVEYELYRRSCRPDLPSLGDVSDAAVAVDVSAIVQTGRLPRPQSLGLQPVSADVSVVPTNLGRDPTWTAFVKRAEVTARSAGFADAVASGFAGAIQEMADNIVQHSRAPTSGIAAFARVGRRFDYVVGDVGIGMLESLRQAPEFRSLRDDLEALPLAVLPGVSRHGRVSGRGYGFRAVFLPLRASHGRMRLRSGRGVLEMQGVGVKADQGKCSQRPSHRGVVVAVQLTAPSRPAI